MKTFIANFGRKNQLWPKCLARPSVASFEDEDLRVLWLANDREGYIARCISSKKTVDGLTPTRSVAARWFNLAHIISSTAGDLWFHREKDELWWTVSHIDAVDVSFEAALEGAGGERVYALNKPTDPWSNQTRTGGSLAWRALHPKAQRFLFTEGTLQRLSPDNAAYAATLIDGGDLSPWHSRPEWKTKVQSSKRGAAKVFNAKERSAARMAATARGTVAASQGQPVLRTPKIKDLRFGSQQEFERFNAALIDAQDGLCALTGLPLQYDGEFDDVEFLCSLDRIDSDGHYEDGNLQVVCRFANRWKNDGSDAEFRRLIRTVREAELID